MAEKQNRTCFTSDRQNQCSGDPSANHIPSAFAICSVRLELQTIPDLAPRLRHPSRPQPARSTIHANQSKTKKHAWLALTWGGGWNNCTREPYYKFRIDLEGSGVMLPYAATRSLALTFSLSGGQLSPTGGPRHIRSHSCRAVFFPPRGHFGKTVASISGCGVGPTAATPRFGCPDLVKVTGRLGHQVLAPATVRLLT